VKQRFFGRTDRGGTFRSRNCRAGAAVSQGPTCGRWRSAGRRGTTWAAARSSPGGRLSTWPPCWRRPGRTPRPRRPAGGRG